MRADALNAMLRAAGRLALAALLCAPATQALTDPPPPPQGGTPSVPGARHGGDGVGGIEKTAGNKSTGPVGPNGPPPPAGSPVGLDGATQETAWSDLGGELPGAATPKLDAVGGEQAGELLVLQVSDAAAHAPAALFLGASIADLPFKGGTLVPSPDLVITGLLVDGAGQLSLQATLPDVLPAGATLCLQLWTVDAEGPQGFAATNALLFVCP